MKYGVPVCVGADLRVCPDTLGEHEYILGEYTGSPLHPKNFTTFAPEYNITSNNLKYKIEM
jgi:hypothetical protein